MTDPSPKFHDPNELQNYSGANGISLELWDYLFHLNLTLDVEQQLIAIRSLINRNTQEDKSSTLDINAIADHAKSVSGRLNERSVEEWIDRLERSVYQKAAHSMAAIGMLAPLMESIFLQGFRGIGETFFPQSNPFRAHSRWISSHTNQWDCHFYFGNGKPQNNIVLGINELSELTGLKSYLPQDTGSTISAVFAYRNKMFHCGFEWPVDERRLFASRIKNEGWPDDWFSQSLSCDEP